MIKDQKLRQLVFLWERCRECSKDELKLEKIRKMLVNTEKFFDKKYRYGAP